MIYYEMCNMQHYVGKIEIEFLLVEIQNGYVESITLVQFYGLILVVAMQERSTAFVPLFDL